MRDNWLKLGCYLIGYNYNIIKNSSEISKKTVRKFLAALVIVVMLWSLIGFAFTDRYLGGNILFSCIGGFIMVIMIIQIERQIILSGSKNTSSKVLRILIGVCTAVIGSIILDQVIFEEDIEKMKISQTEIEVNRILPEAANSTNEEIQELTNDISKIQEEYKALLQELDKEPEIPQIIRTSNTTYTKEKDTITGGVINVGHTTYATERTTRTNPKWDLIPGLVDQIKFYSDKKAEKVEYKKNIKKELRIKIENKTGFLDELKILLSILLSSPIAMFVWGIIFFFLFFIEFFVMIIKWKDNPNDYDKTILHEMDIKIQMLNKLKLEQK